VSKLRAAVIGLGQVGWRFDEEAGRGSVWSHVGAYKALPDDYELAGACDVSSAARNAFSTKHRNVPLFAEVSALLRETAPDVVSICTSNSAHRTTLDAVLGGCRPRAIWCEKPLAVSLVDGRAMVSACDQAKVPLLVSHVRRWSPLWQKFKAQLDAGKVGAVRSLRVAMPNRLWSIGSHAADVLVWLGGSVVAVKAMPVPALDEAGEPAVNALITFENGVAGILQVTGLRAGLVVEAEAVGDDGRLTLREDANTVAFEPFAPSARYFGYRELGAGIVEKIEVNAAFSPFVAIARELAGHARGTASNLTCSGRAALETQSLLEQLAAAVSPTNNAVSA
jgi:predicted dehydrogenase